MIIRRFIIYIAIQDQFSNALVISSCRFDLADLHQLSSRYPKRNAETASFPKREGDGTEKTTRTGKTKVIANKI